MDLVKAADDFIRENISRFGFNGTNTEHNPPRAFPSHEFPGQMEFTKQNHFVFGYNGEPFSWRKSSTCAFWTDYGKIVEKVGSVEQELSKALIDIREKLGKFAILQTGSAGTLKIAATCERLGIEVEQIFLYVPGHMEDPRDPRIRKTVLKERELKEKIFTFCERVRCSDTRIAWLGIHDDFTELPLLFEPQSNRLIDINFSEVERDQVGPERQCLLDNEKDVAIHRYLISKRKPGIPNIFKYSPELVVSDIQTQKNFPMRIEQSSLFPEWDKELRQLYPKCEESCFHPLSQLLPKMASHLFKETKEFYGQVYRKN